VSPLSVSSVLDRRSVAFVCMPDDDLPSCVVSTSAKRPRPRGNPRLSEYLPFNLGGGICRSMVRWRRVLTSVISVINSKAGGRTDRLFVPVPPHSWGIILMDFLGRIRSEYISDEPSAVR
jgi:hypothetical protein